jgi:hypothetical protein
VLEAPWEPPASRREALSGATSLRKESVVKNPSSFFVLGIVIYGAVFPPQ